MHPPRSRRARPLTLASIIGLALLCVGARTGESENNSETESQKVVLTQAESARIELIGRGKIIFDNTCSVCHGLDGEGQGELGFKLTGERIRFATDEQIREMISEGNLTRGMPPFGDEFLEKGRTRDFGKFDEPIDFRAVGAYLRVLQANAQSKSEANENIETPPELKEWGNPSEGMKLFNGKARCTECHSIGGRARKLGPNLAHLASRMKPRDIYRAVASPSAEIGRNYRMKELRTRRGRKIAGIFRNETSESIELLDIKTREWMLYEKDTLLSYRPLKISPMPEGLLDGLSQTEVSDLMAHLMLLE